MTLAIIPHGGIYSYHWNYFIYSIRILHAQAHCSNMFSDWHRDDSPVVDYEDYHEPSQSDPIEAYFTRFPSFTYIPSSDWRQTRAFYDLADHFGWDDKRKRIERAKLRDAWVEVVENEFSGATLEHYQGLCQDLRIRNVPDTVAECKGRLKGVFVNIVDLMQYRKDQKGGSRVKRPRKFANLEELRQYSKSEGKYYPLQAAKSEMLRELLKDMDINNTIVG
jgi:hypothetical protein